MSIESIIANSASQIAGAISRVVRSLGISFEYLLTTAQIESNLNPSTKAQTSSAGDLYQFIDQTWLAALKEDGSALGFGRYADVIQRTADGHYVVPDPAARPAILKLRSDHPASAIMAGAFTRANAADLATAIGRKPTEGELYMAQFLSLARASRLISAAMAEPQLNAVKLFPRAAAANRGIFYDPHGHALNVRQVYAKLADCFEQVRTLALNSGLHAIGDSGNASTGVAPDAAGVNEAFAQARQDPGPTIDTRPLFQAMFADPVL